MVVVLITVALLPFVVRMQGITDLLARCFG